MSHIEPCLLTGVGARDACASKNGTTLIPTPVQWLSWQSTLLVKVNVITKISQNHQQPQGSPTSP